MISAYAVYETITAMQRNFSILYAIPNMVIVILYILNLMFVGTGAQKRIIGLTIAAFAVALLPAAALCLILSPRIIPTMPMVMLIENFAPASVSLIYLIYILCFFSNSAKQQNNAK